MKPQHLAAIGARADQLRRNYPVRRAVADDVDVLVAEVRRLRAAVDAALALHATHNCGKGCANDGKRCQECWQEAPCATVRALTAADPTQEER